jgi:hypothetical protein
VGWNTTFKKGRALDGSMQLIGSEIWVIVVSMLSRGAPSRTKDGNAKLGLKGATPNQRQLDLRCLAMDFAIAFAFIRFLC